MISAAGKHNVTIDVAMQDEAWEALDMVEQTVIKAVETTVEFANLPHLAKDRPLEICMVLANDDLVQILNREYRGKDKPTNVLTFAALDGESAPDPGGQLSLGDVFLSLETLRQEAEEQNKPFHDHLIHLCVHGTLHLLGYDHIEEDDATVMEMLEIKILSRMGIQNPYTAPLDMA